MWARKKIEDLSSQLHTADVPEVIAEITDIALAYRLMTQYTSFVAVDENDMQPINQEAKAPRQVVVPLPLPEGTDFSGVYSVPGLNPGLKVGTPRVMSRQQLRTAPGASSPKQNSADRGPSLEALQIDASPQAPEILSEVERSPVQPEFLRGSLIVPSWQLLAGAINGKVDKKALTTLQKAWEDPMLETVITGGNQYIALRSRMVYPHGSTSSPNRCRTDSTVQTRPLKGKQDQTVESAG